MLSDCAPRHSFKETPHKYRVGWNGRTFPSLQKGAHGEKDPEIQLAVSTSLDFHGPVKPNIGE